MTEKTYINKCSLKEKVFENGSRVLNCAFNVEELASHAKDGWIRFVIAPRRSPNEKGMTHYVYKDSFEPKPQEQQQETAKVQTRYVNAPPPSETEVVKDDGVPF